MRKGLKQALCHIRRHLNSNIFTGCPAAWLLKKNRTKIGKSIVLLSTKIASWHLIRVMIKATSPPHLRLQDLDQLSGLKGVKMISNIYFIGSVTL